MSSLRKRRLMLMYASYMSGLSVSAPSSLTFTDADQPVSLYDYEAHNYVSYSEDFTNNTTNFTTAIDALWYTSSGITVVDATNIQDASAVAIGYVAARFTRPSGVQNPTAVITVRIAQEAVSYNATVLLSLTNGAFNQVWFDPVTGFHERTSNVSVVVTDVGPGTHWDVEITTDGNWTTSTGSLSIYPAWGPDRALTDGATAVANTNSGVAAQETLTVARTQIRWYSAPSTYVQSTGATAGATASYGDIQFADAQYNVAVDAYRLTITVGSSGTIDFDNTAYAAVTENAGGDGTGTIDVTGTLAQLNALFLPTSPAIAGFASETSSISGIIRHVASGRLETFNISVTSTAVATFLLLSDATSYLLLSDGTSKLKLSK